jgi:hypothetical protein
VRPALNGNYQKEAEFLLFKANQYAMHLSTSRLSEMDTFIFHQSTYIPLMTFYHSLDSFQDFENSIQLKSSRFFHDIE